MEVEKIWFEFWQGELRIVLSGVWFERHVSAGKHHAEDKQVKTINFTWKLKKHSALCKKVICKFILCLIKKIDIRKLFVHLLIFLHLARYSCRNIVLCMCVYICTYVYILSGAALTSTCQMTCALCYVVATLTRILINF
jgi:hypothetical protein